MNHFLICFLFLFAGLSSNAQKTVPLDRNEQMSFIENEYIKVGIDLNLGGAITYLADPEKGENLINNADWGRQVQMSFYSGPVPYEPDGKKSHPSWTFIGWNPIQSGDVAGHKSRVLDHKNTGKTLYVKSIPMHWPLDSIPGECVYECWLSLDKNAVKITSRIVNNRPDKTQYPARGQELPAVYTNAPWHKLITYQGDRPFTNDTLSQIKNFNSTNTPDIQWAYWQATESWAANVDKNNYGLGVWNSGVQQFSGGYYGDSLFVGGSHDGPTAYIAPIGMEILDHNITYDYHYTLILGTLDEIRNYVYKNHSSTLPRFDFKKDRQQWYYQHTTDTGWPIKKELVVRLQKDAAMTGPITFWKAADAPVLKITAAYPDGVKKAKIYWRSFRGDFSEQQSMEFDVTGDGKLRTYTVPLRQSSEYKGALTALKLLLNAGAPVEEGKTVRIKSIALGR
ncbi:MAG: hypothetical protein KIT80_20190 [Chitinophagaceae bacterium]|nr:hypothetical protein [Chitinophagaceae bacterium]MCW5929251.1 hypothetical protein [Chitinophagaceae bacterium]